MAAGCDNMDAIRIAMSCLHPTIRRGERLRLSYLYGGTVHYQPGETLGPRLLTDYELVLVIEGRIRYTADGSTRGLGPGHVVLGRPGFDERYVWDPRHRTRHAYFHFGMETIPLHWPEPARWPVTWTGADPIVPALFRHILDRSGGAGSAATQPPLIVSQLVETLLTLLLEAPPGGSAAEADRRPEAVERALKRMRYVLEEEPDTPVSLDDLAHHAGVTAKHLCRIFAQSVGHPPMETFRLLRLQLALALLIRSSLAVKEVAARCGFEDPLYFSRCFSATFKRSPRQVRADLRQGKPPPPGPLPVDVTPRVHW
jgi:AraC family transcriptional regulator